MYAQRNNSDAFARISHQTFVNGASDVKVAAVNSLHGQGVFCQPG
jgi:hypothetical protein